MVESACDTSDWAPGDDCCRSSEWRGVGIAAVRMAARLLGPAMASVDVVEAEACCSWVEPNSPWSNGCGYGLGCIRLAWLTE